MEDGDAFGGGPSLELVCNEVGNSVLNKRCRQCDHTGKEVKDGKSMCELRRDSGHNERGKVQ